MKSRRLRSLRRQDSRCLKVDYQQLEVRNLLTVDLGFTLNTSILNPADPFPTADVSADIGPNHIVQMVNGDYSVRLTDGSPVTSSSQEVFWLSAGADISVDTDSMGNPILGEVQDARVVFDHDSERWFATAIVADRDGDALQGNQVLLAVSRTSNPIDGFQSVQFVGDTTGQRFNSFATLGVDGDGVLVATNNVNNAQDESVSIYALSKSDLTAMTPTAANLTRFENLDENVYGSTIQFATDLDGNTTTSYGLGTFENGTTISLIEISNVGTGIPVTIDQMDITVPQYDPADGGRQPNDIVRLNNISPAITGNVVAQGGYLWTTHTVQGSAGNSAVRWYQIDEVTGNVANTGDIENPDIDFLYPSIAVSPLGGIAIGFTGTGLTTSASTFLTLGFTANGLDADPSVTFPQIPLLIENGVGNYENLVDGVNVFGEYSATRVDPDDPFSFYSFQNYVPNQDSWGVNLGQARITDIAPVINADNTNNEVVLRRSLTDSTLAEIVIDGTVTDVYQLSALDTLELNLLGGDDIVTIDNSLAPLMTEMGLIINGGAGSDTLSIVDTSGHRFDITGDGSGIFDEINSFTGLEVIVGTSGNDIFTAIDSASDWMLLGGEGDDLFDIGNSVSGSYELLGEAGDDMYRLPLANFATIDVIDSVGLENDTLVGLGTDDDDVLLVNNDLFVFNGDDVSVFGFDGIERIDFDGLAGNDEFNIQAIENDTTFLGNDGDDVFNVASDAPLNMGVTTGILGELTIDGGQGANRLNVSNPLGMVVDAVVSADQIAGFTSTPIHYVGNFGTGDDGLSGVVLTGSDLGADSFDITGFLAGNSLLALGGLGDDVFNVRSAAAGDVILDGQMGADTVRTSYGDQVRSVTVTDSGLDDARDRFSIRLSAETDVTTISAEQLALIGNLFAWNGNLENLVVDALPGDDQVYVEANDTRFVRVILNDGDDAAMVLGNQGIESLRFDGNDGRDTIQFLNSVADTFIQARGGDDADFLLVGETSFARSRVDGEAGDDNVEVVFARRDSRRVNARDTGGGVDHLVVTGTPAADRVQLRPQTVDREGEIITYDGETESFAMNLLGSADVLDIYGSAAPEFEANLGVGNDSINVYQTSTPADSVSFELLLASGNDVTNVYRVGENAVVRAFGQVGDDRFNVGSNVEEDNGNLSRIRGTLFLGGGADQPGFDELRVNDRGAGAIGYAYTVTDTGITHDPGPFNLNRPFESFNYSSMEFVLLAGTDGSNFFSVLPSLTTLIRIDGNSNPTPDEFLGDTLNILGNPVSQGRQLFVQDKSGFFSFTDGSQNVSFEEIERFTDDDGSMNFGFGPDFNFPDHRDDLVVDTLLEATDFPDWT